MRPKLKPPVSTSLKLKYDELLSNVAFKFNLRRYTKNKLCSGCRGVYYCTVGRCRLTVSKPVLKLVRAYDFSA